MAVGREVRLRRVYDQPSSDDGRRILVDRLWPRGLSKEAARVDEWLREVAPSTRLRRWYGHDAELSQAAVLAERLRRGCR